MIKQVLVLRAFKFRLCASMQRRRCGLDRDRKVFPFAGARFKLPRLLRRSPSFATMIPTTKLKLKNQGDNQDGAQDGAQDGDQHEDGDQVRVGDQGCIACTRTQPRLMRTPPAIAALARQSGDPYQVLRPCRQRVARRLTTRTYARNST